MRRWVLAGTLGLVAAGGGVVGAADGQQQPPQAATAAVERGDLASMVSATGTLTYRGGPDGTPYAVVNRASGVYTELPAAGDRIGCGDVLYRVDDEPVRLLCGSVPAYRDLTYGDEGRDVRQLNRHLGLSGDEFTWRTAKALGADELDLGDAVVLPRAVRIAKATVKPGGSARAGAEVLQATSDRLEVRVELAASQQGDVRRGDRARVTLPGNRSVGGRVERLGTVARADDGAAPAIPAFIALDKRVRGLDSAPVRVEITTGGVKDVLSVPVTALVGQAGGGFAVEVRGKLVPVELGLFDTAGGRVEVEGELRAGDRVVVPTP